MGAGKGSLYEMKSANSKKNAETEKTKTVTAMPPPSERQTKLILLAKAYDRGISHEVLYATIYSQCFHILYFTEADGRRNTRENIGDFAGFQSDSKQKILFVKNYDCPFCVRPASAYLRPM